MAETRTIDVTEVPEVFLEAIDHLVYMLRMNVRDSTGTVPTTVNGMPFHDWREGFYKWMREYRGGPIIDDSRYTIYDGDPPLSPSLLSPSVETDLVTPPEPLRPGRYRHFKGNEYEVVGLARHSETREWLVVYRPLYGEGGLWVRPLAMFTETVTHDGRERPRFAYLGPG